jgi:hypothetical protein
VKAYTPSQARSQIDLRNLFVDYLLTSRTELNSDTEDKASMTDKLEDTEAEAVTVFTDKDSSSDSLDKRACKFSSVGHAYPSS